MWIPARGRRIIHPAPRNTTNVKRVTIHTLITAVEGSPFDSPDRVVVHVRDEVHRRGAAQCDQEHEGYLNEGVGDAKICHAVLTVLIG